MQVGAKDDPKEAAEDNAFWETNYHHPQDCRFKSVLSHCALFEESIQDLWIYQHTNEAVQVSWELKYMVEEIEKQEMTAKPRLPDLLSQTRGTQKSNKSQVHNLPLYIDRLVSDGKDRLFYDPTGLIPVLSGSVNN